MDDLDHPNQRLQQGVVFATERNLLRVSEALADLAASLCSDAQRVSQTAETDLLLGRETQIGYVAPIVRKITA